MLKKIRYRYLVQILSLVLIGFGFLEYFQGKLQPTEFETIALAPTALDEFVVVDNLSEPTSASEENVFDLLPMAAGDSPLIFSGTEGQAVHVLPMVCHYVVSSTSMEVAISSEWTEDDFFIPTYTGPSLVVSKREKTSTKITLIYIGIISLLCSFIPARWIPHWKFAE